MEDISWRESYSNVEVLLVKGKKKLTRNVDHARGNMIGHGNMIRYGNKISEVQEIRVNQVKEKVNVCFLSRYQKSCC